MPCFFACRKPAWEVFLGGKDQLFRNQKGLNAQGFRHCMMCLFHLLPFKQPGGMVQTNFCAALVTLVWVGRPEPGWWWQAEGIPRSMGATKKGFWQSEILQFAFFTAAKYTFVFVHGSHHQTWTCHVRACQFCCSLQTWFVLSCPVSPCQCGEELMDDVATVWPPDNLILSYAITCNSVNVSVKVIGCRQRLCRKGCWIL